MAELVAAPQDLAPDRAQDRAHDRRWLVLAVLCLSVFVIVIDGTIVNVALPTMVRELGASTSQLQWIVDAYTLVFAGLLLAAGSLGDRYGRKPALAIGLAWFGVTSLLAAYSQSPEQLIAARAAMGVGAALIFPATLAILSNVFREPSERAKAIGIWAAVSGLSVAVGPVSGGWLLEHFWWGSVFLVNIPIVIFALVVGWFLIPNSRDPHAQRLDPLGLVLSIAGVTLLVWAVIEAPGTGWTSPTILAAFAAAFSLIGGFLWWELHTDAPMLDVRIFTNLRFSAGSLSITVAFFALFGFVFTVTQYFQAVRGYSTLEAGVRTLPFAVATGIASPLAPKVVQRFGTKAVVAWGLTSMGIGMFVASTSTATSSYLVIVVSMAFMGSGLGFVTAPATESIMGALPPERAGVGSAVNDTTRELGGTLGVAIAGSLVASIYSGRVVDGLAGTPVPPEALSAAKDSVTGALFVAQEATDRFGSAAGDLIRGVASRAYIDGFVLSSRVMGAVAIVGAIAAFLWLPARADEQSTDRADDDGLDHGDLDLGGLDHPVDEALAYTVAAEAGIIGDERIEV